MAAYWGEMSLRCREWQIYVDDELGLICLLRCRRNNSVMLTVPTGGCPAGKHILLVDSTPQFAP